MAISPNESVITASCNTRCYANNTGPTPLSVAKLTTQELAGLLRIVPQTVRAGLCRNGHYLGLKPVKLPNRTLLWDAAEVERILSGGVA